MCLKTNITFMSSIFFPLQCSSDGWPIRLARRWWDGQYKLGACLEALNESVLVAICAEFFRLPNHSNSMMWIELAQLWKVQLSTLVLVQSYYVNQSWAIHKGQTSAQNWDFLTLSLVRVMTSVLLNKCLYFVHFGLTSLPPTSDVLYWCPLRYA